jgi:hypothetical protein
VSRFFTVGLYTVAILATIGVIAAPAEQDAAQTPTSAQATFGGTYADLEAHQRAVFDDFIARYNQVIGTGFEPAAAYADLPASTRTTFGAITDALHKSTLTDAAGNSLGTALDLVEHIERLNGAIVGAGGDQQFRAYVRLTEDARSILDQSVEFSRKHDNTMFHKDYPLNYRQNDGPPSAQFSMTADGRRADIDVDYRSSGIPEVLWDGHLSVGNSDVRAGTNYDAHVGRWEGLQDWWQNIFGVFTPKSEDNVTPGPPEPDTNLLTFAAEMPRVGAGADLSSSAADFLSAWLVDGTAGHALAYVAEQAYPCVLETHLRPDTDELALLHLLASLQDTSNQVGSVSQLSAVVAPLPVSNVLMREQEHDNADLFTLVSVPADVLSTLPCRAPGQPEPTSRTVGRDEGQATSFRITAPSGQQSDLFFLWEKHGDYWKIVTFHVGASLDAETVLELTPPAGASGARALPAAPRDDEFLGVAGEFLSTWFIERDFEGSDDFLAARANACVDLLHSGDEPVRSENQARERMRDALRQIAETAGGAASLGDVIRSGDPWNADFRLMSHGQQDAFTVVAVPRHLAEALECTNRSVGMQPTDRVGQGEYGDYYGVVFSLASAGEHAPHLALLWARERGEWRVISYDVVID